MEPKLLLHGTCWVLLHSLHRMVMTVAFGFERAAEMTMPGTRSKWFTSDACAQKQVCEFEAYYCNNEQGTESQQQLQNQPRHKR